MWSGSIDICEIVMGGEFFILVASYVVLRERYTKVTATFFSQKGYLTGKSKIIVNTKILDMSI